MAASQKTTRYRATEREAEQQMWPHAELEKRNTWVKRTCIDFPLKEYTWLLPNGGTLPPAVMCS